MGREGKKVLTDEIRMLIVSLSYAFDDVRRFFLVLAEDEVFSLFNNRSWEEIYLLLNAGDS